MGITHIFSLLVILLPLVNCNFMPYESGPYVVKQRKYGEILNWELDHTLKVWVPDSEGTFPLVYHLTGLAGEYECEKNNLFQKTKHDFILDLTDPDTEYEVLEHIASHGYVVVSPYTYFALPSSQYKAEWMNGINEWVERNLQNNLIKDGNISET